MDGPRSDPSRAADFISTGRHQRRGKTIYERENQIHEDLVNGNVHQADYAGTWLGVPGDPDGGTVYYRTVITGTIKGNTSSAGQAFSVSSNPIVIGGCAQ